MNTIQRIEAYKFVLKQFEDGTNKYLFVCGNLMDYGELHFNEKKVNYGQTKNWPEFQSQMPQNFPDVHFGQQGMWWGVVDKESRKTALRNSINLAEITLYHETVKTAVNELGLQTLPFSLQGECTDILHRMITMNGVTGKDFIEMGYRARIAELLHDHELHPFISKEKLYDTNKRGRKYMYMRHYVKPEHVEAVVLAYLRINCPKEVKARKSKVLEAVQDCDV